MEASTGGAGPAADHRPEDAGPGDRAASSSRCKPTANIAQRGGCEEDVSPMRQAGSAAPARGARAEGAGERAAARRVRGAEAPGPASQAGPAVPEHTPRRRRPERRSGRTLGPTAAAQRWPTARGALRLCAHRGDGSPADPGHGRCPTERRRPRRGSPGEALGQRRRPTHGAGAVGSGSGGGRRRKGLPHAPASGRNRRSDPAETRATRHFARDAESAHRDRPMTSEAVEPCTVRGA